MGITARSVSRRALWVTTATMIAVATLVPWSSTIGMHARAADVTKRTWRLAPAVKLTRIRYRNTPNEVRILTILPQRGPSLDAVPAGPSFPMYKLTSGMAASNDAIAGVNGDFATPYGAPVHTTMIDGELWTSGSSGGPSYGLTHDGVNAYVGRGNLKILARVRDVPVRSIAEWNVGVPGKSTVHAYTQRGGTGVRPPGASNPDAGSPVFCAVRLSPTSAYRWNGPERTLITRTYDSGAQDCARTPMPIGSENGSVVLASKSADGSGSTWIRRLSNGTEVTLQYGFGGWPGVTDVAGGTPMLVDEGRNVAPRYTPGADNLLWYNPRTAVGVSRSCGDVDPGTECKIWVVTVDGRQSSSGWSKGMQLPRLAEELQRLGARYAMNLDGGASTAIWIKRRRPAYCESNPAVGGCLANRPSASFGERVTISGLTVLAGRDRDTPDPLR